MLYRLSYVRADADFTRQATSAFDTGHPRDPPFDRLRKIRLVAGVADQVQAPGLRSRFPPRGLVWWARAAVAASSASLVALWVSRPWVEGDTPFVLDGTNALIGCLSRRDFVGCRFSGKLDYWGLMSPMGDWPLLQHIPDLIAVELGATAHPDRVRVLTLLSVAGVVGSVILARVVLTRIGHGAWFWGFLFVVLSGPVLAYARTTAGEMLATGLLVALVTATILRAPPAVVGIAALAACLTKETAYPFVAALGVLGLVLARRRTGLPIRRQVVGGAAGIAVAVVLASLFNVVRFGGVLNTNYLQPELRTPGIGRKLEYALALFVAPNGGLLVFWPAAGALLLSVCLLPLLSQSRRLDPRPALVVVAVAVGLIFGFASWWDPFGSSYGARLTLPWVLPLVLIGLAAYGDRLGELARRLLAPTWRLLLLFAVALAIALPHVGYMWAPDAANRSFAASAPTCDAPWRGGVAAWHACHHKMLWRLHPRPLLVAAAEGLGSARAAATGLAVAVALLGSLFLLREELGGRPTRASTDRAT